MNIQKATSRYEDWLRAYTILIPEDLERKHTAMTADPFSFLRATFYRWIQRWPKLCPGLDTAPTVLAVGDLHVENFGTWRDKEGRLVWGVNDFDEAARLPYTVDLVRLAASANLAIEANHLCLACVDAYDAILGGYSECLEARGKAFVLAERHEWLRDTAVRSLTKPVPFWHKLDALPDAAKPPPETASVALEHMLPPGLTYAVKHRTAGLGSLGHPRYAALAHWEGGRIAREAKALVPSASAWASGSEGAVEIFYQAIMDRAVRCQDPFVALQGHWLVRRLAPDCSRIEIASLPVERDEARLLHAMGWETANIHLGRRDLRDVLLADLKRRGKSWLQDATEIMTSALMADWRDWKNTQRYSSKP